MLSKGRNDIRKTVSEAGSKSFEEFYRDLETKNEERKIYNLAKHRGRKSRDLN